MPFTEEGFIKNHFGSKRGLARSVKYQLLDLAGAYRNFRNIDFENVSRLIFVCSGNICRSPLAEAVANRAGVTSDSYGLHCRGGDKADPRAIALSYEWGLSLDQHITKNISQYECRRGDLIIGMEPKHIEPIIDVVKIKGAQITLSGLWLVHTNPYLHDPYNTNSQFFRKCEQSVALSSQNLATRVLQ